MTIDKASRARSENAPLDLSPLLGSLGFLTRMIQVRMRDVIRSHGEIAVSPATYSVLALVEANPGIRQTRIAELLAIQESNMALLVKGAAKLGLLERRAATRKQAGGLYLTSIGLSAVEQARAFYAHIDKVYATGLPKGEYELVVAVLRKLVLPTASEMT